MPRLHIFQVEKWKKLPTVGGGGGGGGHPLPHPPPSAEASILGAVAPPNENIGGANISFCPPNNFANLKKFISNARIGWKSTVIHYKTIKFNIKLILNIHNSQFFGALRAQSVIMQE